MLQILDLNTGLFRTFSNNEGSLEFFRKTIHFGSLTRPTGKKGAFEVMTLILKDRQHKAHCKPPREFDHADILPLGGPLQQHLDPHATCGQ